MQTIESRFSHIERQLRFQRALIVFLLIALLALVGFGALGSVPALVRAKRFEVVDKDGNVVARPGNFHRGSGALEIFTREGEVMVIASALSDSGYLKIYREKGEVIFTTDDVGLEK